MHCDDCAKLFNECIKYMSQANSPSATSQRSRITMIMMMKVAATATFMIMTKTAMLLLMMMNRHSSFQIVLQRFCQSFSPTLNFTTSFFPLNYHIQSVTAIYFIVPSETPSSTLETS
jgi:hypothetical protein